MTVTTNDLVRLNRQWQEVLTRVENGSISLDVARKLLQGLIEGRYKDPSQVPYWYIDWYINPEQQLENMRRWNKNRGWGFVDSEFPRIPNGLVPSSKLCVPVLAVYLPDKGRGKDREPGYIRTATELWEIASKNQSQSWRRSELHLDDAEHFRLLSGTEQAHRPGIRWVMVDLGAYWGDKVGIRPSDVRDKNSAHAEVLAAAAHFPGWLSSMDGVNVPYVWLAGYLARPDSWRDWIDALIIDLDREYCRVRLYSGWHNAYSQSYAIPVRWEL